MAIAKSFLCFILLLGVISDVLRHKIPNGLIVSGLLGGLFFFGPFYLLPFTAMMLMFLPLYYFRMFGGGDIKLLAVVGGYVGLKLMPEYIIMVLFTGGVMGFAKFLIHSGFWNRIFYFLAYFRRLSLLKYKEAYYLAERDGYAYTIPFSIPITVGYLLFCIYKGV